MKIVTSGSKYLDIDAYAEFIGSVATIIVEDYEKEYFMECQKNIEMNIENSIENNTKTEKICDILPYALSQLTVWNKKFIFENIDIIYKSLNKISKEWMLNLISLKDGKSYIIANNECTKIKLERLFNHTFDKDIMQLDNVWLRKEINQIKKILQQSV